MKKNLVVNGHLLNGPKIICGIKAGHLIQSSYTDVLIRVQLIVSYGLVVPHSNSSPSPPPPPSSSFNIGTSCEYAEGPLYTAWYCSHEAPWSEERLIAMWVRPVVELALDVYKVSKPLLTMLP